MLKKYVFLLLCLLLAVVPVSAEETALYLCEDFNAYPTNTQEVSLAHKGDPNARVIEDGNENKAFLLPTSGRTNTLQYDLSDVADTFILSFKIKYMSGRAAVQFSFKDSGNQSFTPIQADSEGILKLHNGKQVGGVSGGRYTKVDVGYNSRTKRYFVAINGSVKASAILYKGSAATPTLFEIKTLVGTEESAVCIDDIYLYEGETLKKTLPKSAYNTAETEFSMTEAAVGSQVFVNNRFDKKSRVFEGINPYAKNNTMEYYEEKNGNGCLLLDKTIEASDPFMDMAISAEGIQNMVIETDLKTDNPGATVYLYNVKDESALQLNTLKITPEGNLSTHSGNVLAKLRSDRFLSVAVVYHFSQNSFDVYIDQELVLENSAFSVSGFGSPVNVRIQMMPSQGNGSMLFDNMRIYEGSEPYAELPEIADRTSVLPDSTTDIDRLRGTIAFHDRATTVFAKKEKKELGIAPIKIDGILMSPLVFFSDAMGLKTSYNAENGAVQIDDMSFAVGSTTMQKSGQAITLPTAPIAQNDTVYLPVEAICTDGLGREFLHDKTYGSVIISETPFRYSDDVSIMSEISTYLFYPRADFEEIQSRFEASGMKNVHPRIQGTAEDFARLRAERGSGSRVSTWIDNIIREADSYLSATPQFYYLNDGQLLAAAHTVGDRIRALGFAWQITGNTKYAERCVKEMETVAAWPDWNSSHFLDTAEVTTYMAIGYDWCYDYLSDEQRAAFEEAISYMGLEEGKKQYQGKPTGTYFVFQKMNWNMVCNGGLATGALAIMDAQPEIATYTVVNALRSIEYLMPEFAPDGAWVEGASYWQYTVKFLAWFSNALNGTLGTDYQIGNYTGVDKTAEFMLGITGNTGTNNYHDAGDGGIDYPELLWLGRYFNDAVTVQAYTNIMDMNEIAGGVYECLYYNAALEEEKIADMPLDMTSKITETGSMRSSWSDKNGMWLCYSGGSNAVNHYHLDEGAFVLDMLGERWASDIGGDNLTYSSTYHGARYDLYGIRPEGHNTLVINPDEGPGQELNANCPIIRSESSSRGAICVLDLTGAYVNQTYKVWRGFMLTDDRRTAVIRDEIVLDEPSEVYWFMHTRANIEIVSDTRAVLTLNGQRMQLDVLTEGGEATLSVMEAKPFATSPVVEGQADKSGYKKVAVCVSGQGAVNISVRLTPADEYTADVPFTCGTIDSWQVPEGEVTPLPYAKGIWADDKLIHGFNESVTSYAVKLDYDVETIPAIRVDGGEYRVETLREATAIDETSIYRLHGENGKYRDISLTFSRLQRLGAVGGRTRHTPLKWYASSNPEPLNSDVNVMDGDLTTRWSANNTQSVTMEFGEAGVDVSGIAVAVMNAQTRQYFFAVEVSNDGVNYETVYIGNTQSGVEGYQIFDIPAAHVSYVRLTGSGNTENSWNSYTEIAVLQ